jgi:hypothetical protein
MVAQNPEKRNCGRHAFLEQRPDLHAEVDGLQRWLCQAAEDGCAAHEVERTLFDKMLALGRTLFQGFLQLVGPGDFGEDVTLDDGRVVHRAAEQHPRRLLTVFGEFMVARWVYAQRDKTKFEFVPTDQRLQLPASEVSYLLQEWDQLLGIEHAFGKVREVIETILRLKQSVDTLEHTNQQMAAAASAFREEQGPVDMSKEGELLIVTEDNKGIPMVRPAQEKPASAHRTKGEKANKKQMACIGCVYSVNRHQRTPEQLVATLFRDPDRPKTPSPPAQHKRYWAELSRELDGEEARGQDLVFRQLATEIDTRRKPGQWLIHLCDRSTNVFARGCAHAGHLGFDARAVARVGGGPRFPCGSKYRGVGIRASAPDADLARCDRHGYRELATPSDVPRSAVRQEKNAANDLRFLGEEQAPHALR